jgi:uncharacterized protein YfkK (UPF0435 family)
MRLEKFHMLFLDDTEISQKLILLTNIMVATKWELGQMQQIAKESKDLSLSCLKLKIVKETSNRNTFISLQTLYKLINEKLKLVNEGYLVMESYKEKVDNEIYHLASVYRKGQKDIMNHTLSILVNTCNCKWENLNSVNLIHLQHEMLDHKFIAKILELSDELDQDTLLLFVLVRELYNTESIWNEKLHHTKRSQKLYEHALGFLYINIGNHILTSK